MTSRSVVRHGLGAPRTAALPARLVERAPRAGPLRAGVALGLVLGLASGLAVAAAVLTASPAAAHAALINTAPANNEILPDPPAEVVLTFAEPVGTGLGSLRVFDATGDRVDTGQVSRSDDDHVVHVGLRPALAEGTYVVAWRVVSADSHPVSGTFNFSVGAPSPVAEGYDGPIEPPRSPSLLLGLSRFLGFGSLLVLLGTAVFAAVLWPAAARARGVRRLATGAAAVCLVATGGALLLQGPYAAGLPAREALDPDLVSEVLRTTYGTATAWRTGVLVVALVVALGLWLGREALGLRAQRAVWGVLAGLGVAAAAAYAAAGHAGAGSLQPWTYLADVAHLVAVAAWVGGLAVLGLGLRGAWTEAETVRLLPAWSRLATYAVVVLVLTGVFAGWREVRSFSALASTAYGGLLVAKVFLVGFMLMLAAVGRQVVQRRARAVAQDDDLPQLRRTTLVETITSVLVVAVTAVLVQTPPAASAYAPPYTGISTAGPYSVQVDLYPAHKGLNGLHIYTLGESGRTEDVAEITGSFVRADGETITVHPFRKSLGHYEDLNVVLPATGTYTLNLQIRVGELDSHPTSQVITVR